MIEFIAVATVLVVLGRNFRTEFVFVALFAAMLGWLTPSVPVWGVLLAAFSGWWVVEEAIARMPRQLFLQVGDVKMAIVVVGATA